MNYPVLHTSRCVITIMSQEDRIWLNRLFNDKDVSYFLEGTNQFSRTLEATAGFIESMSDAYNRVRGFLWKITYQDNPIGFVCTIDFDENPSLCYALKKSYRKKGLMSEALKAILVYQSCIMDSDYYVEINSENFESYNLCEKLMSVADIIIL